MQSLKSWPCWLRRRRTVLFFGLAFLPLGVLAYLLGRIGPADEICFVPIHLSADDAPCLAHRVEPAVAPGFPNSLRVGSSRREIEQGLAALETQGQRPVVVYVRALALAGDHGQIVLLPGGAAPNDTATWLPLRDVLMKLHACPARHKLLVLDLTPAPTQLGNLDHDLASALPRELKAVPDAERLVLGAASPGQAPHRSDELGQTVFGHYFQEALRGQLGDRITVTALAANVQAGVERWTWQNRGVRQTPVLLGEGPDFSFPTSTAATPSAPVAGAYPDWLLDAWRGRDLAYRSGQYLLTPRLFQQQQATLLALEQAWRAGQPEAALRKRWLAECDRLQNAMLRMANQLAARPRPRDPAPDPAGSQDEESCEIVAPTMASADKVLRLPPAVPGFVHLLEEPSLVHHAAELRLLARGYSNPDRAKALLAAADSQFERLATLNERWRQVTKLLDDTCAELPWYLDALETLPALRVPWEQAALAARHLADAIKIEPDAQQSWQERVEFLTAQLAQAEKHGRGLTEHRQALHAPFAREALTTLQRQCRSANGDARARQTAQALLSVAAPVLTAEDRAALGQACQHLSRRLNEATLMQDRQGKAAHPGELQAGPAEAEAQLAALRARWRLALLRLAGVPDGALADACRGLQRCDHDAGNPAAWGKLGATLRRLDHEGMPQQYRHEPSCSQRERLAWLMPTLTRFAGIDDVALSPTLERRRRDLELQEHWLRNFGRYLARDYRGMNFESAGIRTAREFYARSAAVEPALDRPEPSVRLQLAAPLDPLTTKQPAAEAALEVSRAGPAALELRVHCADDAWLEVTPALIAMPALPESAGPFPVTQKVPLKVRLKPDAERSGLVPPLGFLIEAKLEGRSYHHVVTTPIVTGAQAVQILVSADPNAPEQALNALHLRPGKVRQPYHVYVKNLTKLAQEFHVEVRAGAAVVYQSGAPLAVEPERVRKIEFDQADARPIDVAGPLTLRVLDPRRERVLHERSLALEILSPRDYIKLSDVSYEPAGQGRGKWTIEVQTTRRIVGPAIAAQLVLPMQRIPGLIGIGGGTLRVEVPTQPPASRTLFAEGIRLVRGADEEGPVYVNIDGVPRAFIYRTAFSRAGAASQPQPDDRPAVRLVAPPCVMSGINLLVDVEVDNAPKGARLSVAMGRVLADGSFKAEITRNFADAKKRRIDLDASTGTLTFEASIGDWTAAFDTRSIAGARVLEARLLDVGGKVLASCRHPLVLDDSPPLARITPTAAAVKKGSVLHVQAQGLDPESGVAKVVFFFGREQRGEVPQGAPRFRAIPTSRDRSMWTAALLIPADRKGPLPLSVYVLNHAGMATIDTVTLEVTDE